MSEQRADVTFDVAGWPPIKNEATSMLAARHPYSARVRALLEAARTAAQRLGWASVATDIALDVVVRGPGRPPGDATNFLGGIGDVLQDKMVSRNVDLAHLGDLRSVALYHDDRQIRQISYREVPATEPSYSIRITLLDAPAPPAGTGLPTER